MTKLMMDFIGPDRRLQVTKRGASWLVFCSGIRSYSYLRGSSWSELRDFTFWRCGFERKELSNCLLCFLGCLRANKEFFLFGLNHNSPLSTRGIGPRIPIPFDSPTPIFPQSIVLDQFQGFNFFIAKGSPSGKRKKPVR